MKDYKFAVNWDIINKIEDGDLKRAVKDQIERIDARTDMLRDQLAKEREYRRTKLDQFGEFIVMLEYKNEDLEREIAQLREIEEKKEE